MKTPTQPLAAALRQLANDIQSPDGVANAAIAEAAERLEELMSQNYECKFFIENVMASIGAGATLSEVTDMLCDWWDSSVAANKTPTQCLNKIKAEAGRAGWMACARVYCTDEHFTPHPLTGMTAIKGADQYAERIRKGAKP